MPQGNDWWARQFTENIKEIARAYDQFCVSREIEDFDKAYILHEELNEAYEMSWDLLEFVELGRALLGRQAPPQIME